MATKMEINAKARNRYKSDAKYREYKKKYRKDYEKSHEVHEEKMSREYYKKHAKYRKEKIADAKKNQKKKK